MAVMVVGRAAVDCSFCPWPVHLALLADADRVEVDGLAAALDADEAGVPLALRVHYMQHVVDVDEDDGE